MPRPIALPRPEASSGRFAAMIRGASPLVQLHKWQERWRVRRAIDNLPDHLLRDIGLTREQAMSEAAKPFWRD